MEEAAEIEQAVKRAKKAGVFDWYVSTPKGPVEAVTIDNKYFRDKNGFPWPYLGGFRFIDQKNGSWVRVILTKSTPEESRAVLRSSAGGSISLYRRGLGKLRAIPKSRKGRDSTSTRTGTTTRPSP